MAALSVFPSCNREDPEPVNEEEVITTLQVNLAPVGGGVPVTLRFFDEDGELGAIAPLITVSGPLKPSTTYAATIQLLNETVVPTDDISLEVEEEGNDHLICFAVTANISIDYEDADDNGLPLGLATSWVTGAASQGYVTLSLRHQAGTKTGDCPGAGETDVEVTFNVAVE
ncbi:MAG TPA: hypothetical protein VFO54_11275 [Chryseosolibacter sp.]|nr:hypothetical protein [Chryseosolibacter sp.]